MTTTALPAPLPTAPPPADRPSFEDFCRDTGPRLLARLRRKAGATQDVEDLCQEALVRAWREWEHVAGLACPHAWLYVVADRLVIDGWRRQARADSRAPVSRSEGPALDECDALAVRQAVADLPPDVRSAVVRYYFADWTVERIAAEAGVTTVTVKSRLHRGRAALGAQLREAWGLAA